MLDFGCTQGRLIEGQLIGEVELREERRANGRLGLFRNVRVVDVGHLAAGSRGLWSCVLHTVCGGSDQ